MMASYSPTWSQPDQRPEFIVVRCRNQTGSRRQSSSRRRALGVPAALLGVGAIDAMGGTPDPPAIGTLVHFQRSSRSPGLILSGTYDGAVLGIGRSPSIFWLNFACVPSKRCRRAEAS